MNNKLKKIIFSLTFVFVLLSVTYSQTKNDATPFDDINAWFNKPDSNGDEENPLKGGFSNKEFDHIALTGTFDLQNVPTYEMIESDIWGTIADKKTNEYIQKNAPNTIGKGFKISNVIYYQYRGKNPCYAGDSSYNIDLQETERGNPRLSRFYFYRFTGKGGGIQKLDNFLIAVDTYSKFIFAFSEPTAFNSLGAPTSWAPTDEDTVNGIKYQFFAYDPIGYIEKTPDNTYKVNLYSWFKENIAKKNYKSLIHTEFTEIAKKNPDGAGKSPFYEERGIYSFFKENVRGKTFSYRELEGYRGTDGKGFGRFLYSVEFNPDGTKLKFTKKSWNKQKSVIFEAIILKENNQYSAVYIPTEKKNKKINIYLNEEMSKLAINDITYFYDFENDGDLGPSFINRLEYNKEYKVAFYNNTYKFEKDTNNLIYKSNKKEIVYNFVSEYERTPDYAQAIYVDDQGQYWGIQLSNNGTTLSLTGESEKIISGIEIPTGNGVPTIKEINWNKWHYTASESL